MIKLVVLDQHHGRGEKVGWKGRGSQASWTEGGIRGGMQNTISRTLNLSWGWVKMLYVVVVILALRIE